MCEDNDPSAVSSLRCLLITCTPGSRWLLDTILTYPTPPVRIDRLEHLTIHMQFYGDLYDRLSLENLSLLKRIIDLNRDNDTLVRVSALFIQTCSDGRTPPPFDLPLSHLRALSLDLGHFPDILEVNPLPILGWWTNALRPSHNVPTRLESLTIQLYLDDHGTHCRSSAGKVVWANLDSVLGDDSYPLRRLTILLVVGKDSPLGEISNALDVTENIIRESMPRLVQKGALYFTKDFGDGDSDEEDDWGVAIQPEYVPNRQDPDWSQSFTSQTDLRKSLSSSVTMTQGEMSVLLGVALHLEHIHMVETDWKQVDVLDFTRSRWSTGETFQSRFAPHPAYFCKQVNNRHLLLQRRRHMISLDPTALWFQEH
ncbi:uncharacterized protein BT62DRAFT_1077014 [Guyanagaster necrorhizus]|uniref:Uncharacterized protein n=1 Tax=Guyanagaster necrorhizus TaxID=856835 RepID=A0A9P7VRH3_9AGAR|nr:uncharacterized protein BT62DRAFT_1077014 [Guyanagaster necrorhizus MCA 3950]KAG7445328.1 hypothetical protein BT62DRAFT_1077014 [Guyanagaster necrorhizus MCA 3950]